MNNSSDKGRKKKKVLVLGGAQQHCKLVEAIRAMGAFSVVVDYCRESPAKLIADKHYCIDVKDVESMARLCRNEPIDGVVAGWLDPCQLPYITLCRELGYRHYGSEMAFRVMTDKEMFKDYCKRAGVGTIPYLCGDASSVLGLLPSSDLRFPLFVKPVDSRGSRGQTICSNDGELRRAIDVAARESSNGRVIVEKDMTGADDISVTYFFVNGKAHLERISDRILGRAEDGLSNVCIGTVSPSIHYNRYIEEAHDRVVEMLESLEIENGPVFMQGFVDECGFYFYDPGLRFPGGDYERALGEATGVFFPDLLVRFSLGEELEPIRTDLAKLNGKIEVIHDICVSSGEIKAVSGFGSIESMRGVVSASSRYEVGEVVGEGTDVGRRFAEINFLADGYDEALQLSRDIESTLSIEGGRGDMKISSFANGFQRWYDSNIAGKKA